MVEGRLRMEADRAMGHGRLVARAKGGGGLWLARQHCRDGSEALLLIRGGVDWDMETSSVLFTWLWMGFGDLGCVCDGFQGDWKRTTAKIGFRFGMAFIGVGWEFGVFAFLFGCV